MWDSLENAQKVAKAFNDGDPRFAEYMYAIENLTFMSHLVPEMSRPPTDCQSRQETPMPLLSGISVVTSSVSVFRSPIARFQAAN